MKARIPDKHIDTFLKPHFKIGLILIVLKIKFLENMNACLNYFSIQTCERVNTVQKEYETVDAEDFYEWINLTVDLTS